MAVDEELPESMSLRRPHREGEPIEGRLGKLGSIYWRKPTDRTPGFNRGWAVGLLVAVYALFALLIFAFLALRVLPDRVALSAWIAALILGLLIWVSMLADTLAYAWRRRGRLRAFLAHQHRCVGCGARLLHSMLHEGLTYQCGSCDVIQPWATSWDRSASVRQFTSSYDDEVFKRWVGKPRHEYFARMDHRGASKSHAAAVKAVHADLSPYGVVAVAICYEVDRRCDDWFDLGTPMFEPTLLGMLARVALLIAIPLGLVAWRIALRS